VNLTELLPTSTFSTFVPVEILIEHLDQQHLDAEAAVGRGDLRAGGAGADDCDLLRHLLQRPGGPGVEHAVAELDARDRQRHRAGRQEDVLGRVFGLADDDGAGVLDGRLALDQVDLVVLEESGNAAAEALADLLATRLHGIPVDADALDLDPELGRRVGGLVVDLGGVEDRLRRHAGVVEAAPTRVVLLGHRRLQPELGRPHRGDVAAGSGADHDDVVLLA
jgi:hypothetical protein